MVRRILMFLSIMFVICNIITPVSNAATIDSKEEALQESTYYSIKDNKIVLNKDEALDNNSNLTRNELNSVEVMYDSFSDKDIDKILVDNGYDLDEVKIDDTDLGHANIVWFVPVIIIGILVAGTLIFSGMYFNYKEKKNLVDKCYSHGGRARIDSRDKNGIKGGVSSATADRIGGYKFDCVK
ncbi:hypothetical protein [Macrococcoides bohemicum]|uniref:hypothetical protein n=1 Tax=Macrococcoides bohemicum TaxID=1903056 RepID=UPI00165E2A80|nr:hypothetical protein [Macrococcus bohemicus]MBC9874334.1 hypothetical protein [Macrococcus bohemicus]